MRRNVVRAAFLAGMAGILSYPASSSAQCGGLSALISKQGKEIDRSIRETTAIEGQSAKMCVYGRKVAIPLNQRHIRELEAQNNRCFDAVGDTLLKGLKDRMVHFVKYVEEDCKKAGIPITEVASGGGAAQSDKCPPALTGQNKKTNDERIRDGTAMISENNAGGYNNRGIAYTYLGKYDLAIQDFASEKRQIGKNICGLCLPRIYLLTKEYDLAIKTIDDRRLSRASTAEDGLSCWRGMAHHQKGDYDLAIADYEKAMLNTDDFGTCGLYGRGFSRLKKGDVLGGRADMAAAVAADAKARFPTNYPVFFCYAGIETN